MASLAIDNTTNFSFTDSGVPDTKDYITIIAVHGVGFTKSIFKKVQSLAPAANLRIVAIDRTGYGQSTRFSDAEWQIPISGTEEEKLAFLNTRGAELAHFVEAFIKKFDLPAISEDGKTGGVALLGWSMGNRTTSSAIASIHSLPKASQTLFTQYIRALIVLDVPSATFGLPLPPKVWGPQFDPSIPPAAGLPFFLQWIANYFDHGDLSTRDLDAVEYIKPSLTKIPSIYTMTNEEFTEMVDMDAFFKEMPGFPPTYELSNIAYRKACFESGELLPKMKTTVITGGATMSYCINGSWSIEEDNKALGGSVQFIEMPGTNHFMHWDMPEKTLQTWTKAL